MTIFLTGSFMSDAVLIILKASALLAGVAVAQLLLRRRASAATRHLVWMTAIAGLLLLPVLSAMLPAWPIIASETTRIETGRSDGALETEITQPGRRSGADETQIGQSATATVASSADVEARPRVFWPGVLLGAYAGGVLLMLLALAVQWWSVGRLSRDGTDVEDPEWQRLVRESADLLGLRRPVRVRRSRKRSMPMALGIRRPTILIPAIADAWSEDRRRAVILHEMGHVARYDCLTQALASAVCAMYWFHPGAWWVARRLRVERELACDDLVIAAGTEARDYAGHLLELAYAFATDRAPALAVTMARPRQLEGRLLAALDAARNRRVPAARVRLAAAGIGLAVIVAVASVSTTGADNSRPQADAGGAQGDDAGVSGPGQSNPMRAVVDAAGATIKRAADVLSSAVQEIVPGTWEIRPTKTAGIVHLQLRELNSSTGFNISIDQLEGLSASQMSGQSGPVQFRLRRDAGTFTFEGSLRAGVAAGTYSFAPNSAFGTELAKRGYAAPTAREQYEMARHDVGFAFVDELNRQGYARGTTSDLVRAGQHGVHTTYLREMGALGYRLGTLDPLIRLRDHGVTPDFIQGIVAQGYKGLSAEELRKARDHGVTPDFVRAMREAGYGSHTMAELIKARDHGVNAEFVRELGDAGYRNLPLDLLIRTRDHGITPEYVRGLHARGYGSLTIEEVRTARDHGIDLDFVVGMAAAGYANVPMAHLITARDHGVTPSYAQELKALGYDRIPLDDLIRLRDHGVTPERVRDANKRAGTRLPIDMLIRVAR